MRLWLLNRKNTALEARAGRTNQQGAIDVRHSFANEGVAALTGTIRRWLNEYLDGWFSQPYLVDSFACGFIRVLAGSLGWRCLRADEELLMSWVAIWGAR